VTRPSASGAVRSLGGITLSQTLALYKQFGTFTETIGPATIILPRLLRIVGGIFNPKLRHLPWAKAASLTRRPWGATKAVSATSRLSSPAAVGHDPPWTPRSATPRPRASLPFLDMPPRPLPSGLLRPRAPVGSSRRIQEQLRGTNSTARYPADRPVPISSKIHTTAASQSVAFETVVHLLAGRLSGASQTLGTSRSLLGYVPAATRQRATAVAPVTYKYSGEEPLKGMFPPNNVSTGAILTRSPTGTPMASRPVTVPSILDTSQASSNKARNAGSGNLYLEGSVLGRWMTRRLSEEIVRPRDGTMAVDPRVTPPWGGPSLPT
jgi:hypothetical protein